MPRVRGFLHILSSGHPDHSLPEGPTGHPDQGLPEGESPVDPGYGLELPSPPPGVWPPPVIAHPIVPAPPGTPPGAIWPPVAPSHPWQPPSGSTPPASGAGTPSHPIAGQPGEPSHPVALPDKFWIVAGIPGYGWRYVCVQPGLSAQPKHHDA